jgi:transformation/transcription domain-associated protein
MIRIMATSSDLWRMRKQFTQQLAACSFVSYTLCLPYRQPVHFSLSRSTGLMTMQDLVPSISYGQQPNNPAPTSPVFNATDVVPFRFTPNLQNFVGPTGTEGLLTSALMAIGRSLTDPTFDLEQQLALFGRDEINTLATAKSLPRPTDSELYNQVRNLLDGVVKRADCFACKAEREQALHSGTLGTVPVIQTITNLINNATNEIQLAKMGDMYSPWF